MSETQPLSFLNLQAIFGGLYQRGVQYRGKCHFTNVFFTVLFRTSSEGSETKGDSRVSVFTGVYGGVDSLFVVSSTECVIDEEDS